MSAAPRPKLGIWMSTSLVAGTMIGSGIFLLPASLAAYGGVSLLGWTFTTAGAMLLALTLSRLSRMIPKAGGPYAFTRAGLGEFAGFLVGWGYWLALLTGSAAIAVATVGYLGVFVPALVSSPLIAGVIALLIIWTLAGVNIAGTMQAGRVQMTALILKLLPLVVVIVGGMVYFNTDHLTPFNASDQSTLGAVTSTATLTLWAFLGIESATVAAETVENPTQNISRATIMGTILAAVIYVFGSTAVMMIIPPEELRASTAPFADAALAMFGPGAQYAVAIGATISCLGALNGMILLQGQMPFALARDGLFHTAFGALSRRGTPQPALLLSAALVTVFIALNYSKGLVDLFTYIILLSTLSILLPYSFSTMSECMLILRDRGQLPSSERRKRLILASLAFTYSLWALSGAGQTAVYWGFLLFLTGIPVFVFFKWQARD